MHKQRFICIKKAMVFMQKTVCYVQKSSGQIRKIGTGRNTGYIRAGI